MGLLAFFRVIWMRSGRGKTYISSGILLPSKVTHLVIKRPHHFYFRPGDYVFVNIPAIAKYEWHPFTLSSAPEQEGLLPFSILINFRVYYRNDLISGAFTDYMWLHIRGVGEWTNTLYSYFEREQERLHNGEILPYIPPSSSKSNTLESRAPLASFSPQKDFLSRNLARVNHGSMIKASSLDNPRKIEELQECLNSEDSPALMHSENEVPNSDTNPFTFTTDSAQPTRPPRSGQTSPQISKDDPAKITSASSAKPIRRTSETTSPIKKIQATLQRTFSRKSSNPQDGYANAAFVSEESKELPKRRALTSARTKAPLEKSLSMPDIENRTKKRERMMA